MVKITPYKEEEDEFGKQQKFIQSKKFQNSKQEEPEYDTIEEPEIEPRSSFFETITFKPINREYEEPERRQTIRNRDLAGDDYQRRYQVERNTRNFLQKVFDAFENSSIFQWFRSQESRWNRPRERRYYQSRRNYDGYSYGFNPYSRHEAFVENIVDKWVGFRESVGSQKSEQEQMEEDKNLGNEFANKIDRYLNQDQRYFRHANQPPKKSFLDYLFDFIDSRPLSILKGFLGLFSVYGIFKFLGFL